MAKIPLTKGQFAEVDEADVEALSKHSWCFHTGGYAVATIKRKNVLMHRFIMKAPQGAEVDHINHNRLDNHRANLRLTDRSGNASNNSMRCDNTSGVTGVTFHKPYRKWVAQIQRRGQHKFLGAFHRFEDAVAARLAAEEV